MRLARVDHRLVLGVGQHAVVQDGGGQLGGRRVWGRNDAMAADCTSLVGCGAAPGMSIACRRKVS